MKLNKVMVVGRLGREPEKKTFNGGGYVVRFSLCVPEVKKDKSTGQWVEEPMWLECEAFGKEDGSTAAKFLESYGKKGMEIYCEGKLKEDKWEDQSGNKRSRLKLVVDVVQSIFQGGKKGESEASPRSAAVEKTASRRIVAVVEPDAEPRESNEEIIPF